MRIAVENSLNVFEREPSSPVARFSERDPIGSRIPRTGRVRRKKREFCELAPIAVSVNTRRTDSHGVRNDGAQRLASLLRGAAGGRQIPR